MAAPASGEGGSVATGAGSVDGVPVAGDAGAATEVTGAVAAALGAVASGAGAGADVVAAHAEHASSTAGSVWRISRDLRTADAG